MAGVVLVIVMEMTELRELQTQAVAVVAEDGLLAMAA
jgi:hypothetical protein